jgi:HlyD family secretion protein
MRKLKKTLWIAGGLILLFLLYKIFFQEEKQMNVIVETLFPSKGDISLNVTTTGTVQPVNTVSVGSQVSGNIRKLYVDYNSVVKKGQLLAELDPTLFEASLNQARSNYAQAHSQLVYQESNFNRQSQLYQLGAISKAEYENAQYTYNAAKAQADAASAQVQSAEKNLSFTVIRSPIDGTVLSRSVSEGQTVAASFNTPTIFSIANDMTQMQVEASVDEADIGSLKEGDGATFTVDAYPEDVFSGIISQIRLNPTTTNNVVTYTTIIQSSNPGLKLKPGMTAIITLHCAEAKDATLIPAKAARFTMDTALLESYNISYYGGKLEKDEILVLVKKGNELIQKKVRTGINNNTIVQVLVGLSMTDSIVVNAMKVTDGTATDQGANASPFMPKRPGSSSKKTQ